MRKKQSGPIVGLLVGALFAIVGGLLAYYVGWPIIVEAKASQSWPSTPGKITVSRVESHRQKNKTMYSHHVEYTYAVDGTPHTGNRVWANDGWSSNSSTGVKSTVAGYPVGSETTVYYDPAAPEVCVLQTGTTWGTYALFAFGGLFFVVGALVAGLSLFQLIAAAFMIGAAATIAVGQSIAPTSQQYAPRNDFPRSPADDDDDGIEIT